MEQRRIIGIALLILSGLLFLVSAVMVIIKMPMGGDKVSHLLTDLLPKLVVLAVLAYSILRPRKFDPTEFDPHAKIKITPRRFKKKEHPTFGASMWAVYKSAMSIYRTHYIK